MNLYDALKNVWDTQLSLTALIPATRVVVAVANSLKYPYLLIGTGTAANVGGTSKQNIDDEVVQLTIRDNNVSRALLIKAELENYFNDDLALTIDNEVVVSFLQETDGWFVEEGGIINTFNRFTVTTIY